MASKTAIVQLIEFTFPDITGRTIGAWGQVALSAGNYQTGGLPFGLIAFADARSVDFNGFLQCEVWDEEPLTSVTGKLAYFYNPVNDTLQIFNTTTGLELAQDTVIPITDPSVNPDSAPFETQSDLLMFHATFDRTTVRG
jgi:hypothetical protein